jgi:hypothetical protein
MTSDASIAGSGKRNTASGTRTRAATTVHRTAMSIDREDIGPGGRVPVHASGCILQFN